LDFLTNLSFARIPRRLVAGLAVLLLGLAFAGLANAQEQTPAKTPTTTNKKSGTKAPAPQALSEPMKTFGVRTAPITLEVFSDYQCPSCRAFFEGTLRPLMSSYVAEGKVFLVHRDFPLPVHPYSHDAARWAIAAARIGKFAEVDGALYDNQTAWAADGNIAKFISGALSPADFKRVDRQLEGCEATKTTAVKPASMLLSAASQNCSVDAYIDQDIALGKQVPVQATPTLVITYKGQRYPPSSGAISWPILKQFFDSLLAQ
jgi:protein-disulfide isomerase